MHHYARLGVRLSTIRYTLLVFKFNLFMPNGVSHYYQLGESFSNLRVLGSKFQFHSNFKSIFCKLDQMPRSEASDLVLYCLPMTKKKGVKVLASL